MIAIVILVAIALAWKFRPQQAHRVIVSSVEIQRGKQYHWVPMLNGWFEVIKHGRSTQFKSAPPSVFRSKYGAYWPVLNLTVLIGWILLTAFLLPPWLKMLGMALASYTWDQTSGILATTAANWDRPDQTVETQVTTDNLTKSDLQRGANRTCVRLPSGRLILANFRPGTNDLQIEFTDDATPNEWTTTTRVVVDTSRNYDRFTLAVDSSDNVYLFAGMLATTELVLWRSTDEGATWFSTLDSTNQLNDVNFTSDDTTSPIIRIDNDNFIHFAWKTNTSGNHIRYAVSDRAAPDPAVFQLTGSLRVTHGSVTGGPFDVAETVNFAPSGASGVVARVNAGSLDFSSISGTPAGGDTLTGAGSGATAAFVAQTTIPDAWDIETFKGGTGGASESIDSGFSWGSGGFANLYDMTLTDEGAGVFGVHMVWDEAVTDPTPDSIFYLSKDDDAAFSGSGAVIVNPTTNNVKFPSIASNDDDSLLVVSYVGAATSQFNRFIVSTNGGSSWGSPVQIFASDFTSGNATISYDGNYFWFASGNGGGVARWAQFFVDSLGVATRIQDQALSTGSSEDIPGVRWQRFHMASPGKMDIYWSETASDIWWMLPDRVAPSLGDDVLADGTSSSNMTYDLTTAVLSYTQNTGYGGTVNCTQVLDVKTSGAIIHNAGGLQMDTGYNCATLVTLFNSFTTTRARGTCIATTSVTVSGNTTYQQSASTGNTSLTTPQVSSLGTFLCQDNTVNEVTLRGPDASTSLQWLSGAPDLDASGSSSVVNFGTISNRGLNIGGNFSVGTGTLNVDNQCEFSSLSFSTGTVNHAANELIIINNDWTSSSGTYNSNSGSLVRWTGAEDGTYTITTDGTSAQAFDQVEWAANGTVATVAQDIFVTDFIDFTGTGNIAGTQNIVLTSLTQATPYRNSSASNDMTAWTGEVQYFPAAAAVDAVLDGFYPTLRTRSNGTTNYDINGTLTAEADIIFGDGALLSNIRHNAGTITAVNMTVRNGSDYTHVGVANLTSTLSGTLSVFGRFLAESTTNSYSLTATDIVVTQVIADGEFRFTDVGNAGSTINLGSTAASGLVAGADTIVVILGTFLTPLQFTGFINCTSPDILELDFVNIDTNDVTSTGLTINGDNSGATSLHVRDCDIDSPFMGWAFGGTAWTNTDEAQFLRNDVEIGVRITNDAKIGMTNSLIPDAGMDTGTGSLIVFGTVTAGNLIADIFGDFDAPVDLLGPQSIETGQRDLVNIREPIFVGVTAIVVSADQNVTSWIMDATGTSGTVNGTFTLTTNATTTLTNLEILGIFDHNTSQDLNIIGVNSLVRANSGGEFRVSTACTVSMDDSTVIRVSNDSFITLLGVARSSRVTFVRNVTSGNEPFIHIQEAATTGSGGINFNFVRITDYGAGNVAAVHVEQNGAGVFDDVRFFNCSSAALDISGATGSGAAQPGIQITSTSITDCGVGLQGLFGTTANSKNLIQDVIIEGCSIGISFGDASWGGTMHNVSSINNSTYGLQIAGSGLQFDNAPGTINHCVFHGVTADINMVAGALDPKLTLTNCILSDKAVSAQVSPGGTTWQVISYNHNRVNTKEVIVFNDLVIDSNTTTPIHCDKFDWSGFNIAADGASYVVPAAGTPISELIPVQAGASYFISFTGTLATFDVVETLLLGGTFTAASGLSSGAIHTVGGTSAYLQISWVGAVAAATLTHLEIREDTSGGDLIYNEDLINKFKSPNSGWQYDSSFGLAGTSGSPAVLPFGDFGYEFIEMIVDIPIVPTGDRAGVVLGWQNANNYYEVYLDGTNNDVRINKVVAGAPTLIDSASTFNGSSVINPNATAYTMRITWNKIANNAIEVHLDNGVVEDTVDSAGWVNETTNDFVTDAQFDVGNVGLISEDVVLDNLKVLHDGFYIREADLTLATGISITVQNGGVFDTNEVVVNASQSVLNVQAGGTNNQTATTWLDDNFDENVLGPQTLECGNTLEVTGDIVWGVAGEADWTGITIVHATPTSTYRIITDAALTALPITARGISLPNVQPSIRPLDGSEGRYDLDPTKPSPSELILQSPDPVHRREAIETPVWGADRARVTPWTMDSKRFTLRFFSKRDKCLWGKCEKWKDNATPLEVVYYRGIVFGVIITNVRAARVRNNKSIHEWEVDFIEAR